MKTAALPPVRIEPDLRQELEAVLGEGESISAFVAGAVRGAVAYRRARSDFLASGEAAWAEYQRTGQARTAEEVFDRLEARISARRRELGGKTAR
ncbi:MAG TPA: YlcI/YnfO family protein [Burkholderiaceae bacterium]|jgi:hypothetical protein|nr:YlcI/YnfO family protein [Burkholderiaceae bacterium]